MNKTLINFVARKNGITVGCHSELLWTVMDVVEIAEEYKTKHESKPDEILVYTFRDSTKQFEYLGTE